MTERVKGKVAFITGAARGQGRSHAVRLAQEGADIIAVDICSEVNSVHYPLASSDDLVQTVKEVEALGRQIVAVEADVRDVDAIGDAAQIGVDEFGRLDIVAANAGIFSSAPTLEITEQAWRDMIDINLTGVWQTCKATVPHIIAGRRGGSIVITSSVAGLKGTKNAGHYVASKHGLVGLMRTLALELAPESIRVNTVHPTMVNTDMILNSSTYRLFRPDLENPTLDDVVEVFQQQNPLSIKWVEPIDVSNALLFLASDEGRYVTGIALSIDGGTAIR